jgi:hypothetical protein
LGSLKGFNFNSLNTIGGKDAEDKKEPLNGSI